MGMNSEGSAFDNSRGRASVIAFPVSDWERGEARERKGGRTPDLCYSIDLLTDY